MAYREIFRSEKNDGQGDDAYVWAGKTNENMQELFGRQLAIDGNIVFRAVYDSLDPSLDAYKDDDRVSGWAVFAQRHVEGIILDASDFNWPGDIDDANKFFITNDVQSF